MIDPLLYPVEAVLSLNGRIYAMLSADELAVLNFYLQQGRKYGVSASIIGDPAVTDDLHHAASPAQAAAILRRSNSTVSVSVLKTS